MTAGEVEIGVDFPLNIYTFGHAHLRDFEMGFEIMNTRRERGAVTYGRLCKADQKFLIPDKISFIIEENIYTSIRAGCLLCGFYTLRCSIIKPTDFYSIILMKITAIKRNHVSVHNHCVNEKLSKPGSLKFKVVTFYCCRDNAKINQFKSQVQFENNNVSNHVVQRLAHVQLPRNS